MRTLNPQSPEPPPRIEELVARHGDDLARYARSLAGGDEDLAADAVQETWLRLARTAPERWSGFAGPWIFRVCRTRVLDALRARGRALRRAAPTPRDPAVAAPEPADPSPGARARLESAERHARLRALVDALPPLEAEVVRLRFQAGLSYAEIATVTGKTSNHVGVILHGALKRLRASAADSNLRP